MSAALRIPLRPLTQDAFAPFGQVIECAGHASYAINGGTSQRFTDLAQLESDPEGRLALSIFQAQARAWPMRLECLERHPFGSQAFVPMDGQAFIVVVATARPTMAGAAESLAAFLSDGKQGINFRTGIWHHPLLALSNGRFLVADRIGPGSNCEEVDVSTWQIEIDMPDR